MSTCPFCTSLRFNSSSEERLVAGSTLNDDDAFLQRSPKTGERFPPVLTVGDDLGDHGVELRRNGVALRYACVHAHAWALSQSGIVRSSPAQRQIRCRILRIQARFDRVTVAARGSPSRRPPRAT